MGWGRVQKIFRMQTLQNRAPIWVRDQGEDRVVGNSTRVMPSAASSGWFEGFGFMFTLGSSVPYLSSATRAVCLCVCFFSTTGVCCLEV